MQAVVRESYELTSAHMISSLGLAAAYENLDQKGEFTTSCPIRDQQTINLPYASRRQDHGRVHLGRWRWCVERERKRASCPATFLSFSETVSDLMLTFYCWLCFKGEIRSKTTVSRHSFCGPWKQF